MSLRIAYTDRDTLMIACGDIVTEVPLTPPSGSSGVASSSSSAPAPAPPPAGRDNPIKIGAPKHGPRTMLIMPGKIYVSELPGYSGARQTERPPHVVSQAELEQLQISLAGQMPGTLRLIPERTRLGDPIISCTISRGKMTDGFSTEMIEKVFEQHKLSGLVALKLDFDTDDG